MSQALKELKKRKGEEMNNLNTINDRHNYLKDEMDKFSAPQSKFQKDFDDIHDKIMKEQDEISLALDELLADL